LATAVRIFGSFYLESTTFQMPLGPDVRKHAATMFTDIAGYTAIVQHDEASALCEVVTQD